MAINKKVQFLRNNSIYTGATGAAARTAAIAGMRGIATGSTTSGEIVDGQAILARYNAAGSASTGDVQTIYGIVHKGVNSKTGVTVYESSELLWAAINENVSTSTTISAGTGLSGGGALSADVVTISHKTATVNTLTDTDQTQIGTARTFTAVTGITDDGLGHMSSIKKAIFKLPNDVDSAVTQSGYTTATARPILLKNGTGTASTTAGVAFVTAATIDGTGNFFAKTSVSSPSISATTYENLPVDPDTAMTQTGMGSLATGNYPILTKMDTTNNEVTSGAYFANDVTVNNNGDLSAKTSVKSATISGTSALGVTVSATSAYGATISGGSVTASGNIRGGNVSADTISAATHVKAPTISATSAYGATISGGTYKGLPSASSGTAGIVKVVETTGTTSGNTVMSQKAVTDAITGALADVADALVYQGTVAGTATSPGASLPAANKGDVYKVSTSGYVAGVKVEVGDMFICNTDNTASGTASTNWDVIQTNVDMANYVQTARTVTAGTGLSGGGNLGSDVTIRHKTATVSTLTDTDQTQIGTARTFTAVTGITDDGMGHMSSIKKAIFKLPDDVDSAVTQERLTASTSHPIILKVNSDTSASANNKVYYSSAATVDKTGNIKTTGNVSGATISGANIYGATAISGGSVTASGTVTAKDVTASTSVKSPTISGTTVKGVTVSATSAYGVTISAGTGGYKGLPTLTNVTQSGYTDSTARPIVLKNGTGTAQTTGGVAFVTAATIDGSGTISAYRGEFADYVEADRVVGETSITSPEIYGDYISGGTIEATSTITASGFSATANASTASTDINASILLSNGKNTNIIDCGTY